MSPGKELEMGKVFVGGLSRDTTTTGLRCYFEQFGHISDCVVMKDRSTGAPRGFGFVTYRHQNVADHVVAQRHLIDGKEVEAKPAVPRDSDSLARPALVAPVVPSVPPVPAPPVGREVRAGELKIFVGG
uniref:RRM domain-containing protein n=3 Tax=Emiliania huxleyi TaxID=2903 RepID=A0A0D3J6N2_EMIH1